MPDYLCSASTVMIAVLTALSVPAQASPLNDHSVNRRGLNCGSPDGGCVYATVSLDQKADPLKESMWATDRIKPICDPDVTSRLGHEPDDFHAIPIDTSDLPSDPLWLVFANLESSDEDGYVWPQEVWSAKDHGKVDEKNLIASDGGRWYFPEPEPYGGGTVRAKQQVKDDKAIQSDTAGLAPAAQATS